MTADAFTINSSKIEFFLIGLKTQLAEYATPQSIPPTRFVGPDLVSANNVVIILVISAVSALTLITKQPLH